MATVLVPTMRAQVDPNPRGSATAHVTMASANPFEREVVQVRRSNQRTDMLAGMGHVPRDMMPGMGEAAPSTGWDWGSFAQDLVKQIGIPLLQQELLPAPQPQQLPAQQPQQMHAQGTQQLPSAQPATIPHAGSMHAVPQGYSYPPQTGGGVAQYLPWIIGGAGLLVVGAVVLKKSKKRR